MQASCGYIGSNQDLLPPFSKILEQFFPFILRDIAGKYTGGITFAL